MTKDELEIFEKLILTNNLYTENLVKTNETLQHLAKSQELIIENLKELNEYLKQTGENNFQGIISNTVSQAVIKSNKPLITFIKFLAVLTTFIGGLVALIKLFF